METAIQKKRKKEICLAAKDVFLTKGVDQTSMEDIIEAVGMSKGGVYYYYSSTLQILIDICHLGMDARKTSSLSFQDLHSDLSTEELIVELTIEKIFGGADYVKLWAMLLVASAQDERLRAICAEIRAEQREVFLHWLEDFGLEAMRPLANDDFVQLMDAMFVAGLYLDTDDFFKKKSDLFREIIRNYLKKEKGEIE